MPGLLFLALSILSSCQYVPNFLNSGSEDNDKAFEIRDIKFSEDLSKITISCMDLKDLLPTESIDTLMNFRMDVATLNYRGVPSLSKSQPTVTGIKWSGSEKIKEADICMLALVDLTRPEDELVRARNMLKRFKLTFGDNLFLTFMLPEGKVSYTIPATDYALDVYVSHSALRTKMGDINDVDGKSYLYSGISEMMERLAGKQTHTYLDSAAYTAVSVFSSEDVYDNDSNYPYDPNHFDIQDRLLTQLKSFPSDVSIYFLDGLLSDGEEEQEEQWNSSIIDVVCKSTGGKYLRNVGAVSFIRTVLGHYDVFVPDYEIMLDNPYGNIYNGKVKRMKVDMYTPDDSLLATAEKVYSLGDIYHPVAVGNVSSGNIWLRGTMRAFLMLLLTYIILQLIVPAVRYRIFRIHHIVAYKGPNQTHNGLLIPETCYLCKGTFKPGDKVVARCSHVVHEDCWEENGQHCPEYGTTCETGSHFYDRKHPYNSRNAPFYMQWVILSIIVAWAAWSAFILFPGTVEYQIVDYIVKYFVERFDAISMESMDILSSRQYHVTLFASNVAFFSTIVGSVLSVHRRKLKHFILDILIRGILASALSFMLFGIQCAALLVIKRMEPGVLIEMIPWAMSVLVVEYVSTYRTRFRPNHRKFLISSLILSLFLTVLISPCATVDYYTQYLTLIFGYIVFMVGVTFVLINPDSKKRHPYLTATGSFKEMDIALYKWFLINPHTVVTIGRSVDCSINLFMDMAGDVAPVHCSIRMDDDVQKLCISDNDVILNGRTAKYNKEYRLYYGDVFVIGGVKFRYHGI